MTLFFQCGSFDVWRKLRELRSATLGMESRKANISSFVLRGGSEVMFWEPQNSSLHHKGGEILLPMVAESECTNCKQYIEWQTYRNKTIILWKYYIKPRNASFLFSSVSAFSQKLILGIASLVPTCPKPSLTRWEVRDNTSFAHKQASCNRLV